MPCFRCDSATDQKVLTGPITDTDEHCFWGGMCYPKGFRKDGYRSYNADSVCEICQPMIKADGFSLVAGHFHDRDFALTETQRGSYGFQQRRADWQYNQISQYGMIFESQSNGCQVMPELTPTVTVASGSMTSGGKLTEAIKAVNEATAANKGAETAWMHYYGDTATCTKASVTYDQGGVSTTHTTLCENTPALAADTHAVAFETILYYGQSMARVKVQQGLVILKAELNNGNLPAAAIADLKQDIVAHMLITPYQVVIHSAHTMQSGTAAADASGLDAWNVVKAHWTGNQNDKERLDNLLQGVGTSFHYCGASELLVRNMPASSSNHYGASDTDFEFARKDALTSGVVVIDSSLHDASNVNSKGEAIPMNEERVGSSNPDRTYLSAADLGVLKAARGSDGVRPTCNFPPSPPPPPAPLKLAEATVVFTLTASGSVSDYSDTSSLQQKMATAAGVDKSRVTIVVTAASVIITATIAVPAGTTAAAVQTLLSSTLGTAATASASLGITVESAPAMTATEVFKVASAEKNVDSSDSGLSEGEIAGVAIGGAVGGIVLLGVVGLGLRSLLFKEAKPVFTCLEKSTAKSPA